MSAMPIVLNDSNVQRLFGNEAAENEPLDRLRQYYFKGKAYEQVTEELPLRILVGHKGVGKSALFKISYDEDPTKGWFPVFVKPDDISSLSTIEDKNFLALIRNWKQGLTEIIAKKALDVFGNHSIRPEMQLVGGATRLLSFLVDSINVIKEHVQLDPARQVLLSNICSNKKVTVYLDDLDRGWEGKAVDIRRISALLNAARDLCSDNPGLMFRIALRSDVYFLVRTSDESTDKIEGSVVWYSWENHEIFVLLIKRILAYYRETRNDAQLASMSPSELSVYLDRIMGQRFFGKGKWRNVRMYRVLMSLIRRRPRDLVKLCTLAARNAYQDGSTTIHTEHFTAVFEEYSQGRIQDTVNEFRTELPNIERLLLEMRPSKKQKITKSGYFYSTADLLSKLGHIMSTAGGFRFSHGAPATEKDLAHFLFKIGFLTARKDLPSGQIQRKDFEQHRYISSKFTDFGYGWEVHPAYRWALQPENLDSIFDDLEEDQANSN